MQKFVYTIIAITHFAHFANCQNTVNAGGGNISKPNTGSVNYSIGNTVYSYQKSNNISFSEGVQHAIEIVEIFSSQKLTKVSVYPNPTTDYIVIDFGNYKGVMNYSLSSTEGKLLTENRVDKTIETVQMQHMLAGVYFLKIIHNNTLIRTFKITKF